MRVNGRQVKDCRGLRCLCDSSKHQDTAVEASRTNDVKSAPFVYQLPNGSAIQPLPFSEFSNARSGVLATRGVLLAVRFVEFVDGQLHGLVTF